jgi:hypothetical protein
MLITWPAPFLRSINSLVVQQNKQHPQHERSVQDFMTTIRAYPGQVPKKDRVWLASCKALAVVDEQNLRSLAIHSCGGRKPTRAVGRTLESSLMRRRQRQGPPYKCPLIRELLWDWFVDIRRSVCTTISPKFVLLKARELADSILKIQRSTGTFGQMPIIDKHWLLRWKRDKGVVFRKPNMRFKCSKQVMLERLRAMWLNCIRVRRLAERTIGRDLSEAIYGIDEKPIHFNESGSKNVSTLEIAGAPSVRLKQNHAATRERVSLMTVVTSSPLAASQPRRLPLELLFKAKSARRTRHLDLPDDLNVSVQWAEKGSYRVEHILNFLKRWLDEWTPERASCHDYRILFMDVAKSHLGDPIIEMAWSRGYLVLYHYGCTTGVAQVNDTDLHGDFERHYLEFEQAAFNAQQLYDPGCVTRTLQNVVDDSIATWAAVDHGKGVSGHRRTGVSVRLDGSEDYHITREALLFWNEANMQEERLRVIAEIDAQVDAGTLTFADWRKVILHPKDPGVLHDEGQELEGDFADNEKLWLEEADAAVAEADDRDVDRMDLVVSEAAVIRQEPGDDQMVVHEAEVAVRRLATLKRLRRELVAQRVPAAGMQVDREVSQLERGLRAKTGKDREANNVLRRHLAEVQLAEAKRVRARQEQSRKRVRNVRRAKLVMAKSKKLKDAKKATKAALKKRVDALPKTWSVADCSQPLAKGTKSRADCLERLMLCAPDMEFADRVEWPRVRDRYAARARKIYKVKDDHQVGPVFIETIRGVQKALAEHFGAPTQWNKDGKKGGDQQAFVKFFRRMRQALPKPATEVCM